MNMCHNLDLQVPEEDEDEEGEDEMEDNQDENQVPNYHLSFSHNGYALSL